MTVLPHFLNQPEYYIMSDTTSALDSTSAKTEEKKFQHYASAQKSTQLITEKGKKFSFTNKQLVTEDPEIIEYLDRQIKGGLNTITKGALMTAKEADPMRAIKEAAIAEYLEEQKKAAVDAALGKSPDMGSTDKNATFTPAGTKDLPNAAQSNAGTPAPATAKK